MWFGCEPNGGVDAESDMCEQFFIQLKAGVDNSNGSVILPDALEYWRPGNDGNMISIIKRKLQLNFVEGEYEFDEAGAAAMNSGQDQEVAQLKARIAAMEEEKKQ